MGSRSRSGLADAESCGPIRNGDVPIVPLAGRRFNALSAHLSPAEIESAIRLVDQPVSDRMRGAIGEEERTLADSGPTFTVTNLHTEVVPYRTPFAASLAARSRARSPASTLAIE